RLISERGQGQTGNHEDDGACPGDDRRNPSPARHRHRPYGPVQVDEEDCGNEEKRLSQFGEPNEVWRGSFQFFPCNKHIWLPIAPPADGGHLIFHLVPEPSKGSVCALAPGPFYWTALLEAFIRRSQRTFAIINQRKRASAMKNMSRTAVTRYESESHPNSTRLSIPSGTINTATIRTTPPERLNLARRPAAGCLSDKWERNSRLSVRLEQRGHATCTCWSGSTIRTQSPRA